MRLFRFGKRQYHGDTHFQFSVFQQTIDFRELVGLRHYDHHCPGDTELLCLFRRGRIDRAQELAAALQGLEGALLGVSAHGVEDHVHVTHLLFEFLRLIIDEFIRPKLAHKLFVAA
jgi:hypothetical protein